MARRLRERGRPEEGDWERERRTGGGWAAGRWRRTLPSRGLGLLLSESTGLAWHLGGPSATGARGMDRDSRRWRIEPVGNLGSAVIGGWGMAFPRRHDGWRQCFTSRGVEKEVVGSGRCGDSREAVGDSRFG